MNVSVVSLALSLIVVMGFTSTLYHPNLAPVLAEESFQNYTVAESIIANELDEKGGQYCPPRH